MKRILNLCVSVWLLVSVAGAQTSSNSAGAFVPRLMKFNGVAKDVAGKPLGGVVGVTFALYSEEQGGAALWMETQNVQADASGRYNVSLGANKALPVELFSSGEARWLGVQVAGQKEGNRILLLSVPYALKAADAETVGGLPPSAFVLAAPPSGGNGGIGSVASNSGSSASGVAALAGTGTTNFLPLWTNSTTLGNSALFQTGGKVGIGNTTPAATLDVTGGGIIRGLLLSPSTGTATATKGFNSNAHDFVASVFNKTAAVNQTFRFQVEPAGNNTATASGTLNLLYGAGAAAPAETGLKINNKGLLTFAPGQTFPGGSGTVTSVALAAPASDFKVTGSPITGAGTLNLGWTVAPTSAGTANAIVKRDGAGNFAANTVTATTVNAVDANLSDTAIITSTNFNALVATSSSTLATTVSAFASATTGPGRGVEGQTNSNDPGAKGVFGVANATSGFAQGVGGISLSPFGLGVVGQGGSSIFSSTGLRFFGSTPIGVVGDSSIRGSIGVLATADDGNALEAENNSPSSAAVVIKNRGGGDPLDAFGVSGTVFIDGAGNLAVSGAITAGVKDFRIDHPLDPSGKYLTHASIESSEMLNLYTGNTVLGADGSAAVALPDWFTALNEDFRYQLTPIGGFAQLYIAEEITGNTFRIAGGRSGMKVSWQVTGVRRDAYAKMHPLVVESDKQGEERGHYLHPDAFGQPLEMGITAVQRAKVLGQHAAKPAAAR
jgi:hypothetical protein